MASKPSVIPLLLVLVMHVESAAAADLPGDFVYLRDVAPEVFQDIRYARADNFTGAKVPGYEDAECILKRSVAEALKKANGSIAPGGFALKVYDCYRPERAVKAFMRWAGEGADQKSERYYPNVARGALVPQGYIAPKSSHSLGIAVDLTIVETPKADRQDGEPKAAPGDCTASEAPRSAIPSLDMGSNFDCFDARSHTSSSGVNSVQTSNRQLLVQVMSRYGFTNYHREWWHFTHQPSAAGATPHDFPIKR